MLRAYIGNIQTYLEKNGFSLELNLALKCAIAAMFAWIFSEQLSHFFERQDPSLAATWSVLNALIVMKDHLGGTYIEAWVRFLGVLLGTVTGALAAAWLGTDLLSLGLSIAMTISLSALLRLEEAYKVAALSCTIVVLWPAEGSSLWEFAFNRWIDSVIGIAASVIVSQVLWDRETQSRLQNEMQKSLSNLNELIFLLVETRSEQPSERGKIDKLIAASEKNLEQAHTWIEQMKYEPQGEEGWSRAALRYQTDLLESLNQLCNCPFLRVNAMIDFDLQRYLQQVTALFISCHKILLDNKVETTVTEALQIVKLQEEMREALAKAKNNRRTSQKVFSPEDSEAYYFFFFEISHLLKLLHDALSTKTKLFDKGSSSR